MSGPAVLQIGCGGFGPVHLQAWLRLGLGASLRVADPDPAGQARAAALGVAPERITADYREVLGEADVVDVVAATDRHQEICEAALAAGKDVFCEKPLTLDLAGSEAIAAAVAASGRVFQVGYYFRHHPLARYAKARVGEGALGDLRYLGATFVGFKRARRDSGVTGNDAVHFLDLVAWLEDSPPVEVYAIRRDHLGRGLDDFALIVVTFGSGVCAKVEVGYIQPGRWPDTIVPGAQATKELVVCGSEGALEIDLHIERIVWHRVRHELADDGLWHPRFEDALLPHLPRADAVDVVASQLREFLGHVEVRSEPEANARSCGIEIARLLQAIDRSSAERRPVAIA